MPSAPASELMFVLLPSVRDGIESRASMAPASVPASSMARLAASACNAIAPMRSDPQAVLPTPSMTVSVMGSRADDDTVDRARGRAVEEERIHLDELDSVIRGDGLG